MRKSRTEPPGNAPLIIGVGNRYRMDDGVGIAVARQIGARAPGWRVLEMSGEGASLMAAWSGASDVVLIDAVRSGKAPGTIHRLDAAREPIPSDFFHYSTHAFSVAEAVEMARVLQELPPRLVVYGVEGASFGSGGTLTRAVAAVVDDVVRRVLGEFGRSDPHCSESEATHA